MTYLYKCDKCKETTEITKPMSESSKIEKCKKHKIIMNRVYTAVGLKTAGDGVKV